MVFSTINDIDLFMLTESWQFIDNTVQLEETSPPGYFD